MLPVGCVTEAPSDDQFAAGAGNNGDESGALSDGAGNLDNDAGAGGGADVGLDSASVTDAPNGPTDGAAQQADGVAQHTDGANASDGAAAADVASEQDAGMAVDVGKSSDTGPSEDTSSQTADAAAGQDAAAAADVSASQDAGSSGSADAVAGCASDKDCAKSHPATACMAPSCKNGACSLVPVQEFKACDDGVARTTLDACSKGKCVGKPGKCDDSNACTADKCEVTGCKHEPLTAKPCDDGSACTVDDVCDKGKCAGAAKKCDDNNPCTKNLCDAKTGCAHPHNDGAKCGTGTTCSGAGTCGGGVCKAGKPQLFENTFPYSGKLFTPWDMAARKDGKVLQVGVRSGKRLVRLVNDTYDEQWAATIGNVDVDPERIVALDDGSSIVSATHYNGKYPNTSDGWLGRVSAAGKVLWEKNYDNGGAEDLRAVAPQGTGFLACGSRPVTGATSRGWLIHASVTGVKTLDKTYGTGKVESCHVVVPAGGGGALVGFTYTTKASLGDGVVVKVGAGGVQQWFRTRTGGDPEEYAHVTALPSGDLMLSGGQSTGSGDYKSLKDARTDAFGNFSCADSGACQALGKTACLDGKACTLDTCDPKSGCKNPNAADGLSCGANKSCGAGVCK